MPESFHDIIVREQGFDNYREGAELLRAMGQEADNLDDALADNAKGLDAMSDELKETADELTNVVNKGKENEQTLKNQAKEMKIFGVSVSDVQGKLNKYKALLVGVTSAKKGLSVASRVLRVAMLGIPLVALVVGFTSLVAFMTRTQRGLDVLTRLSAGLGAAMEVLSDVLEGVGERLFSELYLLELKLKKKAAKVTRYCSELYLLELKLTGWPSIRMAYASELYLLELKPDTVYSLTFVFHL